MAKKYKMIRVPEEIQIKLKSRAIVLSKELTELTKKKQKVPMTKLLNYYANKPLRLYPSELVEIFGKGKKNHNFNLKEKTIW